MHEEKYWKELYEQEKEARLKCEKQLEERTESLTQALIKAQNADYSKSEFITNISHEIRTPLNAIIGFSQVLSKSSSLNSVNNKHVSIIESSATTLLSTINDILDLSKIQSGKFKISIEKCDIHSLSRQIVEFFSHDIEERDLKLIFTIDDNIPKCIMSDSIKLRQVISNLLSNAIKFSEHSGEVEFFISLIKKENKQALIRFEIKDNGIGIAKDKLEGIFNAFIQLEETSNKQHEGIGLGLSISSHIVKLLNSVIKVDSKEGEFTKFWFDLPCEICEGVVEDYTDYMERKVTLSKNNEELESVSNNELEEIYKLNSKYVANTLGVSEKISTLLVEKFLDAIDSDLQELNEYISINDEKRIKQKSHYIKNNCLNLGFKEAVDILQLLESYSLDDQTLIDKYDELSFLIESAK